MKRLLYLYAMIVALTSCTEERTVSVTVTNPTNLGREQEMVEVPMEEIANRLQLADTSEVLVIDEQSQQVPCQLTYDGKLIFPATVKADGQATYTIKAGTPEFVETIACGKIYPERLDDIAWENDRAAYRAYGPALQAAGERAYGYDVFTKSVPEPVVEERYRMELDPQTWAQIDSLKKAGNTEAAAALRNATSYHIDHGNGMDVYTVGSTLGGGATAFFIDDRLVYPYCYAEQEILDNGPLRFTAQLTYHPLTVATDSNVVETRLISLDKGSYLNRTAITYTGLNEVRPLASGFVLHDADGGQNAADASQGYIAYADPTNDPKGMSGTIYLGAVFPGIVREAGPVFFSEAEKKTSGAFGHILAVSDYEPGETYIYYWGSGWSRGGIESMEAWTKYLEAYACKVRNPLTVTIR